MYLYFICWTYLLQSIFEVTNTLTSRYSVVNKWYMASAKSIIVIQIRHLLFSANKIFHNCISNFILYVTYFNWHIDWLNRCVASKRKSVTVIFALYELGKVSISFIKVYVSIYINDSTLEIISQTFPPFCFDLILSF